MMLIARRSFFFTALQFVVTDVPCLHLIFSFIYNRIYYFFAVNVVTNIIDILVVYTVYVCYNSSH